jgi:hypothetical protein
MPWRDEWPVDWARRRRDGHRVLVPRRMDAVKVSFELQMTAVRQLQSRPAFYNLNQETARALHLDRGRGRSSWSELGVFEFVSDFLILCGLRSEKWRIFYIFSSNSTTVNVPSMSHSLNINLLQYY